MQQTNITLYTVIGNPAGISTAIRNIFSPVTKSLSCEEDKTTLVFEDDTQIIFNLSHAQNKAEFIEMHTSGMANYFAQAETDKPTVKENVLLQIQHFNCVVGIVFETDENENRTHYITNTLFDLAAEVNGFLLYPNMHIYTPQGKLLYSSEGKSELESFAPIANADLLHHEQAEEAEADIQRRQRSIALLQEQGIPYHETLRSEVTESEALIQTREEIVKRAAALFAVAVYSEVMLSENPDRKEALTYFYKMDEIYGINNWITDKEANYVANPEATQQERIQFVWQYENCASLLWSAGIIEELPYPAEICNVAAITEIFWQNKSIEELLSKGVSPSDSEILDAADLSLRYDWACVDARINKKEAPMKLDGGIVMERHYTFHWIIGASKEATWDEIQPNT